MFAFPVDTAEVKYGLGRYLITLKLTGKMPRIPTTEMLISLEETLAEELDCLEVQVFPFEVEDAEIDVLLEGVDYPEPDPSLVGEKLYDEAGRLVRAAGKASTSFLQRRMRIGYVKAASLITLLEERGVIGPYEDDGASHRLLD